MANIYLGLLFLIYGVITLVFNGPISRFDEKVYRKFGFERNVEIAQIIFAASSILSLLAAIVIFMEIWGIWAIIGGMD